MEYSNHRTKTAILAIIKSHCQDLKYRGFVPEATFIHENEWWRIRLNSDGSSSLRINNNFGAQNILQDMQFSIDETTEHLSFERVPFILI